jgi:hypothetical protein
MTHQSPNHTATQEVRAGLSTLLDDLEYHRATDVQARLVGARLAEAEARQVDATDLAMRARPVQADMLESQGDWPPAAAIAMDANHWARDNGQTLLLARSHVVLAAIFDGIGDSAACLENSLLAVELSDESTPPRTRANSCRRELARKSQDGDRKSRLGPSGRATARVGEHRRHRCHAERYPIGSARSSRPLPLRG